MGELPCGTDFLRVYKDGGAIEYDSIFGVMRYRAILYCRGSGNELK